MTDIRIRLGRLHGGGFEARIEGQGDTCLIADKDFPSTMLRLWSALAARFNLPPQEARVTPLMAPVSPDVRGALAQATGIGVLAVDTPRITMRKDEVRPIDQHDDVPSPACDECAFYVASTGPSSSPRCCRYPPDKHGCHGATSLSGWCGEFRRGL